MNSLFLAPKKEDSPLIESSNTPSLANTETPPLGKDDLPF